ncbi:MAG: sortase [Nocardioidaceae bacterium]|jgi:sortase A|nr:sortase [Nocardioidaceae bacterium]
MLSWFFAVLSGFALFFVAFLMVLSPLQESRAQAVLYTQFRSELAAATAPFGVTPIPPGSPVAVIDIQALGIRQVVVEGTSGEDLRSGPGHLRVTAFPGQAGTSVIFGRSTTYGGPFRDLPKLHRGDPIQVTTGQGVFTYQVEDVRRSGDPQPPALRADQSRLLLVTTDSSTLGALSTVYIDALLVGTPAVTPPRQAVLVPDYENEMASDPSALLPLALWLFALVATGVFAAWGVVRWGSGQTWLVVIPVLLAVLWGASDNAAMLLPNLM